MGRKVQAYVVMDRRGELRLLKQFPRLTPGTLALRMVVDVPDEFFDPPEQAAPLERGTLVIVNVEPLPPLRAQRAEPRKKS